MDELVFDPLRRCMVARTPEEDVRQWMIGILRDNLGVPVHLMMSEAGFRYAGRQLRADILVYDRSAAPLMVVECKRPQVELSEKTVYQALRYDAVLSVRYIILTNGNKTFFYRREGDRFTMCSNLLSYEQMLKECQQ